MRRKAFTKIGPKDSGSSLIDWLSSRFTYLSAESWLNLLSEGRVRVDGLPAAASRPLAAGEVVAFDPPDREEPEVDPFFSVVMEDDEFIIVDKSGNLPCHPGGSYFEHSLWYLMRERYGDIRIATRLDRETSGLVLACKSAASAAFVQSLHAEGALEKDYLALVHGRFPERADSAGYLIADIASAVRKKRRYVESRELSQGKGVESCVTCFELVKAAESIPTDSVGGPLSLVRARPKTGRTHQIRATLYSMGFPLVGDKLYGLDEGCFLRFAEGKIDKEDLMRLMLPNQALHCTQLSFSNEAGRVIRASSAPRWKLL